MDNVYQFLTERQRLLSSQLRSKGLNFPSDGILRSCVRLQPDGLTLSLDADGPDLPAPVIDEGKMTATFCITTPRKDRYGDIVLPRGCEPHLENYRRNPRVFFGHKSNELPIGSARTPEGNLDLEVFDDWIKSTCYFHGETPESDLVFRLICRKELQSASIGFLPVKAAIIETKKDKNRPDENELGEELIHFQDGGFFPQLRFHEWDLTEWSVVSVPANADAISMHLHRGHVDGQPITESFKKAFGHLQTPVKVWSPGVDLKSSIEDNKTIVIAELEIREKNEQVGEVEEDPQKGWPLGARFLKNCLDTLHSWSKKIEEQDPELEHPRVKRYAAKKMKRIAGEMTKLQKFGSQCYPDKFQAPEEPEQMSVPEKTPEAATAADLGVLKEVPVDSSLISSPANLGVDPLPSPQIIDQTPMILEALRKFGEQMDKTSNKIFELTGKKV